MKRNSSTIAITTILVVLVLAFGMRVSAESGIRISEVHPRPGADLNGDGRLDNEDAFVEVVSDESWTGQLEFITGKGEIVWEGEISPAHPAVVFSEIFTGYSNWVVLKSTGKTLDERGWEYCPRAGSWTTSCGSWHLVLAPSPWILDECLIPADIEPTLVRVSTDGLVEVKNETVSWLMLSGWSVTAPLSRRFFPSNPIAPGGSWGVSVRAEPTVVRLWTPFGELRGEVRIDWTAQPPGFDYVRATNGSWSWSRSPVPSQPFSVVIPLVLK